MRFSRVAFMTMAALLAIIAQVPSAVLATSLPAECSEASGTVTCTYTSGDNEFPVPAGVTTIHAKAVGGNGGSSITNLGWNGDHGLGAAVVGDLSVSPGSVLHAVVGGNARSGGLGGFNGGGPSGAPSTWCIPGGGGGASDVRTDATLASRVLVAAGGGGGGCAGEDVNGIRLVASTAGGSVGSAGHPFPSEADWFSGVGGGAGCDPSAVSCSNGGAAALGGGSFVAPGAPGTLGAGGAGSSLTGLGGGGGGGFWGGGGGGGGEPGQLSHAPGPGGGGGGGSNLIPEGGSAGFDSGGPKVELSYTAPAPVPMIQLSASTVSIGDVQVGSSDFRNLVITNGGDAGTVLSVTSITSSNPDYVVSGCLVPAFLSAGQSCTEVITFAPAAVGADNATLIVSSNDPLNPTKLITLTGNGTSVPLLPRVGLSDLSLAFGNVAVGTTSAAMQVTIVNTGDAGSNLQLGQLSMTGPNASDYALSNDPCSNQTVSSCTVDITYSPTAAGSSTAWLAIPNNSELGIQSVSLTGTGTTPSADLAVSISASPNPAKTRQKVTYTITLLNAGPATATTILINDTLASQSTFVSATITGGTCVTPVNGASGVVSCSLASLASGASKPIQIVVTVIAKKTSITNTVTVSAATADPNLANNTASITTRLK